MSKRTNYAAYPWFTLRSPMLPVEQLDLIPHDPQELKDFLQDLYKNTLIRESIQLGSHDLSLLLDRAFASPIPCSDRNLLLSFLRYVVRLCSRCTPFGTFAGFVTGTIGQLTDLRISSPSSHHLHARPDMEFLVRAARWLEQDPGSAGILRFYPNSSLYRVGERWHYVETGMDPDKPGRQFNLSSVDEGGVLSAVLGFCTPGRNRKEIIDFLQQYDYSSEEVIHYCNELIDSQVLVSELEPVVCGPEYLSVLLTKTATWQTGCGVLEPVREIARILAGIQQPENLSPVREQLSGLATSSGIGYRENHLIQVDMRLGAESAVIDSNTANQVLLGIRIARALSAGQPADPLKGFREAFRRRYGGRTVDLVKALDPETGIGLEGINESYLTDPVPWVEELGLGWRVPAIFTATGSASNPWLAERLAGVLSRGERYLIIDSRDLRSLDLHGGEWPVQMWAMTELFNDDQGETAINLLHASAGNPAFLLGRFGFADPNATARFIREMIRDEEQADPDALFAEVVCLPEERTGNILQRPSFFDHEIPYLAQSAKRNSTRIPVTDLMVSLSGQRVELTWKATGQRIEPRMTNAYNHDSGRIPLYRFLHRYRCQHQDPAWKPAWGMPGLHAPFVPGIRFRNIILLAPVWTVNTASLVGWIRSGSGEVDTDPLLEWKNSLGIPDEVLWMSGDQELLVDWTNPNRVLAFWEVAKQFKYIRLRPFYQASTPVMSPAGSLANQLIFCFRQT